MWAEVSIGGVAIAAVLGAVFTANSYTWPAGLATQYALKNGISGGNGVYAVGAANTFPNKTSKATNYWVDVVLATG